MPQCGGRLGESGAASATPWTGQLLWWQVLAHTAANWGHGTCLRLYLLQELTKIAASPLCQMALALWLGIPCLSYQCFAGLHICEGWMFEMLLQKGGLTHSCRVCALSAPYSTYIADRMGHCIYIDRKVLILLRETMQVNCKNCFRKQSSSCNFT